MEQTGWRSRTSGSLRSHDARPSRPRLDLGTARLQRTCQVLGKWKADCACRRYGNQPLDRDCIQEQIISRMNIRIRALVGTGNKVFPFYSYRIDVKKRELRKKLKQILIAFLSGVLMVTACAPAVIGTPVSVTQEPTSTQFPIPANTSTSIPTTTPTASITPLPTIPTFTPTFDTSTLVTVTQVQKAKCLEIDSTIKVENYLPRKLEYPSPNTTETILDFLNAG